MIKAVLFDYGGVLTEGGRDGSVAQAVSDFFGNLEDFDIADLHDRYGRGQMTTEEFLAELNRRYGEAREITAEDYLAVTEDIYIPRQSVHNIAVALRTHEIQTGILTNTNALISGRLQELGAYTGFEPLVLSHEVGARKPERSIYEHALGAIAFPPSEVIFVDDKPSYLPPARDLGMLTVHASTKSANQLPKAFPAILLERNNLELNL